MPDPHTAPNTAETALDLKDELLAPVNDWM